MKEQVEVRSLKEGRYVLIDDEPCTIIGITSSKPGKHGSAKARVEAIGIFDSQKRSIIQPVTAKIYVPIVERKSGQVLSLSNEAVQLMDTGDYSTFEMNVPAEFRERLEIGKDITYITSMGRRKIDMR
ncbi:MAG: translation initiation factor IF-5A [Methanocellales archaeon]|nr:translation initiation factor IF-5A [Methanocellales archaeon]MDD3421352.1 translation initiation factor IF-5A [Methanocellales archaeon]MDD4898783.1 translation initiation factor IF-5A [Methanocellales archaeon]MDD5446916.1 translation initiation factor IF-5A [Methanocellales archaeon]